MALLAPDKEKLNNFATRLETFVGANAPAVKTKSAQEFLDDAEEQLSEIVELLRKGAKQL